MKIQKEKEDLTGRVFGRLTVLGFSHQGTGWRWYYRYRCECGREGSIQKCSLKRQGYCGKCIRVPGRLAHGGSYLPEYKVWTGMKARCMDPKDKAFARYGGRGIKVSEDWMRHGGGPPFQCWRIHAPGVGPWTQGPRTPPPAGSAARLLRHP
jgi:hypothetical protein